MSVEESYYNGLCIITCVVDKEAENGKTITVSNGVKSFTGTIANKKCTFKVPGKYPKSANTEYVVTKYKSNGEIELAKTVEVGYGDSITVHMDPGYEPLLAGSMLHTLEEVEANTEENHTVDALVVKEVSGNMGGIKFGIDGEGNYGYFKGDGTFCPFNYHNIEAYTVYAMSEEWTAGAGHMLIPIGDALEKTVVLASNAFIDPVYGFDPETGLTIECADYDRVDDAFKQVVFSNDREPTKIQHENHNGIFLKIRADLDLKIRWTTYNTCWVGIALW